MWAFANTRLGLASTIRSAGLKTGTCRQEERRSRTHGAHGARRRRQQVNGSYERLRFPSLNTCRPHKSGAAFNVQNHRVVHEARVSGRSQARSHL